MLIANLSYVVVLFFSAIIVPLYKQINKRYTELYSERSIDLFGSKKSILLKKKGALRKSIILRQKWHNVEKPTYFICHLFDVKHFDRALDWILRLIFILFFYLKREIIL